MSDVDDSCKPLRDMEVSKMAQVSDSSRESEDSSIFEREVPPPLEKPDPAKRKKWQGFQEQIHKMRQEQSRSVGINRFPWQSRLVVKELMKLAISRRGTVNMCVGMPIREFYGKYFHNYDQELLDTGGSIVLILADPPSFTTREYWQKRTSTSSGRLSVYSMREYNPRYPHFCLVEDFAYRVETPHARWDEDREAVTDETPERPARFSFNDPQFGRELQEYAKFLISRASPITGGSDPTEA